MCCVWMSDQRGVLAPISFGDELIWALSSVDSVTKFRSYIFISSLYLHYEIHCMCYEILVKIRLLKAVSLMSLGGGRIGQMVTGNCPSE